jgi:hypothetical protein
LSEPKRRALHLQLVAAPAEGLRAREGPSLDGCGGEATPLIAGGGIDD